MNAHRHIDPEDLALFALQFLSPEQSAQVRQHLQQCRPCQEELALIQGDLAIVACTAETHAPPALARDRLMQQVAREPKQGSVATAQRANPLADASEQPSDISRSRSGSTPSFGSATAANLAIEPAKRSVVARALPWAGWAVAAGLAVMVAQSSRERDGLRSQVESVNHQIATVTEQSNEARRLMETINDPSAQRVTLTLSKQAPVPQGKATYVAAKGALVFVANNMEPLQPAKVYELWIIPASGSAPIAAGTFHPDAGGDASVIMPKLPEGVTAKAFGITIENEGGSQTPTMPILMAGAAGV
jgi:hypothetical protein